VALGANRGIGLNLVRTFVRRGWVAYGSIRPQTRGDPSVKDVSISQLNKRQEKQLTEITYKLEATGATILEIDYTNETSIIAAAKEYGSGSLDCLVNCTGKKSVRFVKLHEAKLNAQVLGPSHFHGMAILEAACLKCTI
jgi:NAD(P)-dependent dehydrogenase (short-subunit alcohol dehydrogenase family)